MPKTNRKVVGISPFLRPTWCESIIFFSLCCCSYIIITVILAERCPMLEIGLPQRAPTTDFTFLAPSEFPHPFTLWACVRYVFWYAVTIYSLHNESKCKVNCLLARTNFSEFTYLVLVLQWVRIDLSGGFCRKYCYIKNAIRSLYTSNINITSCVLRIISIFTLKQSRCMLDGTVGQAGAIADRRLKNLRIRTRWQ